MDLDCWVIFVPSCLVPSYCVLLYLVLTSLRDEAADSLANHLVYVLAVFPHSLGGCRRLTSLIVTFSWIPFIIAKPWSNAQRNVQSTLFISNSKGLWNTSRYPYFDISDLQNWETNNSHNHILQIYICNWTLEVRDILKILWKRGEIAPKEQFLLFSTIFCYMLLDFHV